MNKKTILAAALAMAIFGGMIFLKGKIYPPAPQQTPTTTQQQNSNDEKNTTKETNTETSTEENNTTDNNTELSTDNDTSVFIDGEKNLIPLGEKASSKDIVFSNSDVFIVTFASEGGVVKSIKLKEHEEKDGSPVEMINTFESDQYSAFDISLNNEYDFIKEPFNVKTSGTTVTFFKDFYVKGAKKAPFRMEKIYEFSDHEYAFKLTVNFKRISYQVPKDSEKTTVDENDTEEISETDNGMLPFSRDEAVYSLNFGPQIGPTFAKLSTRKGARSKEFRNFVYMKNEKRKNVAIKKKETRKTIKEDLFWAGINGKYFSVIIKPNPSSQQVVFSADPLEGITDTAQLIFTSGTKATETISDSYIIYCGPNQKKNLEIYNSSEKNDFDLSQQGFDKIISGSLLGWLEWLIRQLLDFIYGLIPNYGIAIILATILIKAALFPVTHKSYESTSKMQKIQPQVAALKEKFKDKPQDLNAATMELYKQEGVNPMGGCLPMLLQMPFLFAFFGLLNKHFGLRNAVFIPGWITDLSGPETIYNFNFVIPLLKTSEFHILPFIYLGVQLLTTKITQANSAQASSNMQMKLMTYGMPIFFFFIMYSMPSGLLIYWTMSNIITVVQQVLINKLKNKS